MVDEGFNLLPSYHVTGVVPVGVSSLGRAYDIYMFATGGRLMNAAKVSIAEDRDKTGLYYLMKKRDQALRLTEEEFASLDNDFLAKIERF